jgi:hypothetical protein
MDHICFFLYPLPVIDVSKAYDLPILINNLQIRSWEAVRQATKAYHPDGWAANAPDMPLTEFKAFP